MKVALTGATGFLGGRVLRLLLAERHEVAALARRPQGPTDDVRWVTGALDDEGALLDLCTRADAVIHVAGVTNAPDHAGFDAGNRVGTLAMLHAAEAAHVDRFVHVSSLAAREPQLSAYGATKRAGEDAVVVSTRDWRIVRPPGIYGPGEHELLDLFRMAARGVVPLPPAGRASWVHVDDIARLLVMLAVDGDGHVLYEADDGMPGGWAHTDFARALGSALGRGVLPLPLPRMLLGAGAKLDGWLRGPKAKLTPDRVAYLAHTDWTIDPGKRPPASLWTPRIATAPGLAEAAADYRSRGLLN